MLLYYNHRKVIIGSYTYVTEGKCHFLPYETDTLVLYEDGKMKSKNFPRDATYTRRKTLFEDEIKITSKSENSSSYLLVEGNIFTGTRLSICLDVVGYYQIQ